MSERELMQLEKLNKALTNIVSSVRSTNLNLQQANESAEHTQILFEYWIRILSQASVNLDMMDHIGDLGVDVNGAEERAETLVTTRDKKSKVLASLEAENDSLRAQIESLQSNT
ncbi:uncharacterized protein KQ657_004124 [Scheffersomyces spartinae]|uniref:Uncharacterized protein n=1 Tax=Scheffersomyces spartinae TaxID=45513 RepID=A0A9P7VBT4_9ASCO|nr:uncharacterized protein KQ657_004124 [Scheffersomyces spartinae]KAG7195012.1 hypothetical protein KQ657_004124 [Scheffersomyces spartinae]